MPHAPDLPSTVRYDSSPLPYFCTSFVRCTLRRRLAEDALILRGVVARCRACVFDLNLRCIHGIDHAGYVASVYTLDGLRH
eukprot:4119176-Pyramimonas_sp.AAC.1